MKNITMSLETARELYKTESNKKWLLENFTKDELEPRELVRSWDESILSSGYSISNTYSTVLKTELRPTVDHKNTFRTEQEALAYGLAAAQLSQICSDANGDWVADWNNAGQEKWTVNYSCNTFIVQCRHKYFSSFPMKSQEIAEACLAKHRTLWEQFYMIQS